MIFGTDGVRDLGGKGLLAAESVDRIGTALVQHLHRQGVTSAKVLIGRDTRVSGPEIEKLLTRALHRGGVETIHAGVLPTPAISVLVADGHADLGLMISASHNPPEFNGIKILDHQGEKLSRSAEVSISADYVNAEALEGDFPNYSEDDIWVERYLDKLLGSFPDEKFLNGFKVVLDTARGAACHLGPELFRRVGAEVFVLNGEPDGANINVGCGSLHPKVLAEEVLRTGADLGVAFDGDADRALFFDHTGASLDGDDVIALWALNLQSKGLLSQSVVALTVMSNMGVEKFLGSHDIRVIRTPVGDREVAAALRETGGVLGGETSGHIIYRSAAATGDGLRTGLSVCQCVVESAEPLAQFTGQFSRFPLEQRTVRIENRPDIETLEILQRTLEEARVALGDEGRFVVRFSGTEPLLRILVEASSSDIAQHWVEEILHAARREETLGSITLVV